MAAVDLFTDLPLMDEDGVYHAIIEIPKGSRIKYEFSEKYNTIVVDRVFRTPVSYPQNYGFFPQAWNKFDNDPPDVVVVSTEVFHPGVVVPVRVVGMIEMEDTGELDHKIIAVPTGASDYASCYGMRDLDQEIIENLKWFLQHYKYRDLGEKLKVLGAKNQESAVKFLKECHDEFNKMRRKIKHAKETAKREKRLKKMEMRRGTMGSSDELRTLEKRVEDMMSKKGTRRKARKEY